jgi:hypothetical protein
MENRQEPSPPGSVSGELLSLVEGTHPKSRWVRGGMIGTALVAGFVAPYLGLRQYRLRLVLGISAVWFVIALVIAFRESRQD